MNDEDDKRNEFSLFAEQFTDIESITLDIGCGCGQTWSGPNAVEDFRSHECPLRGVELSADEVFDLLADPSGLRRAHKANIADGVAERGFVVQPVFPVYTWEEALAEHGSEGLRSGVSPNFAYTIGLWPEHAELMVRGYGRHCADIATFMGIMVRDGRISTEPATYDFMSDDGKSVEGQVKVIVWSGDPGDFGQAAIHHGTDDFGRVLCVLADDDGLLPEDGGAHVLQLVGLPEWRHEYEDRLPHE